MASTTADGLTKNHLFFHAASHRYAARPSRSVDRDNNTASRVGVFLVMCCQHRSDILLLEVIKNDFAQFPSQGRIQLEKGLIQQDSRGSGVGKGSAAPARRASAADLKVSRDRGARTPPGQNWQTRFLPAWLLQRWWHLPLVQHPVYGRGRCAPEGPRVSPPTGAPVGAVGA